MPVYIGVTNPDSQVETFYSAGTHQQVMILTGACAEDDWFSREGGSEVITLGSIQRVIDRINHDLEESRTRGPIP